MECPNCLYKTKHKEVMAIHVYLKLKYGYCKIWAQKTH